MQPTMEIWLLPARKAIMNGGKTNMKVGRRSNIGSVRKLNKT